TTDNRLRQLLLAESIAGDSTIAHATAFTEAIEKLTHRTAQFDTERSIALELERMAMGIADTGALCMDVGYQLGQVACEALRTMTINTTQAWCGNRFGKGLIRPAGTNHPLTPQKAVMISHNVAEICGRYCEVCDDVRNAPTLLARFEQCGIVMHEQMAQIGGVGQAARASGMQRDLRTSHPWGTYQHIHHTPITETDGDVMARLKMRFTEVQASAAWIAQLLDNFTPTEPSSPDYTTPLAASSLAFGLVEGWRGETCHVVVTNSTGAIATCKIKDPSLHNWSALALAVRGEGISDFPICNKSFNLSYCGHDL
ncbi:MAG: NADH dehydrogenase subunit, partial [Alistipes sp.]